MRVRGVVFATLATAAALVTAPAGNTDNPVFLVVSPTAPSVGDVVSGTVCGLRSGHWYGLDTYGPNTPAGDGPLDSTLQMRAPIDGCVSGILLDPAPAGTFSAYLVQCSAKGSQDGCLYGAAGKVILDQDFTVAG